MEALETKEYRGFNINIYPDDDPINPRDWDNCSVFVCEHPRYSLGDVHDVEDEVDWLYRKYVKDYGCEDDLSIEEKLQLIEKSGQVVWLPISMYDHSGIDIWLGSASGHWDAEWDCSMIGFAYVEKSIAEKEGAFGPDKKFKTWKDWAYNIMKNAMRTYSQYCRGEVYGFMIDDMEGDSLDSCWNYYGEDGIKQAFEDAKDAIDNYVAEREKEHKENLALLSQSMDSHIGMMVVDGLVIYRIGKDMFSQGCMERAEIKSGVVGSFSPIKLATVSDTALKLMARHIQ